MPTLRATIMLELDGEPVPGFHPCVKVVSGNIAMPFNYVQGTASQLGVPDRIAVLSGLAVRSDHDVTIQLNTLGITAAVLKAGGLVLLIGCEQSGDLTPDVVNVVTNSSGETARLDGVAIGS